MPFKSTEKARAYAREYMRKRRRENPEALREASRRFYAKNKEYFAEYQRVWRSDRTEGYLLSSARRRAKKNNIPFNIDISDIVVPDFCPALGIRIDRKGGKWADNVPTLDRRDPRKGYVKGKGFV